MTRQLGELGFYTLAGAATTPRDLIDEVRLGEELGLGHVFISERWNVKEAATLAGAVGAVSSEIGIATAATHHSTRHPLVTASHATTMHTLTGGRYTLEVSSPGIERPLRTPSHFRRAVGTQVSLRTMPGVEGERRLTGRLDGADDDSIELAGRRIPYAAIERARTVFEWGSGAKPPPTKKRAVT